MKNDEIKKILEWIDKKGKFTWADLQKQFGYDNKQMVYVQTALRSNMPISKNLVDHPYISGEDPNFFVLTTNGRLMLSTFKNEKSPLISVVLLILSTVNTTLKYFALISPNLFWIILGIITIILLFLYWHTKNTVWGGLTIGLIVGIILWLFGKEIFTLYTVVKSAIIGALIGFVAELLGELSDYLKQK